MGGLRIGLLFVLVFACSVPLAAELPSRASQLLKIKTADSSLAPLPGVDVVLLRIVDATAREEDHQLSNNEGEALFEVGPGTYEVRASLDGFLAVTVGPLTLDEEQRLLETIVMVLPMGPTPASLICY